MMRQVPRDLGSSFESRLPAGAGIFVAIAALLPVYALLSLAL